MSQWQKVPLNKVAEIERDSINPSAITNGTTYVGLENIETGGLFVNVRKVTKGELASSKFAFTDKHILYGKLRPYLAKIARPTFSGICSTDILPILPSSKVNRDYLTHFLCQSSMIELATSRSTGANLPRLSPKILAEFLIPLPPIDQQKRIAAILDKAEELRRLRRQSIEHLDVLSRSIFIEMFGSSSAPKGEWNIVDFGDLIDILTDYHANGSYEILRENVVLKKQSDYALMVRTTDLENNNFEGDCIYIDEKAYNFLSKSKVYGGEIIINKIGSAGKVYLMPHLQKPVSLGMNAFLIKLNSKTNILFIYYFLTSSYGKAAIDKNVKGAVTKTITKAAIRGIKTPVPPLPLQQEFAQRIEVIESLKAQHRESLAHLDILFASLQHRAFRGEL